MSCLTNKDCLPLSSNKLCFPQNETIGECKCNFYFGWTGSSCDEFSVTGYIQMAWLGSLALVCLCLLILTCVTTKLAWDLERKRLRRSACSRLQSVRISTLVWFLIACMAATGWVAFRAANYALIVDTGVFVLVAEEDFGRQTFGKAEIPKTICHGFAIFFAFLGGSQILLIWFTIAESSSRLLSSKHFSDIYLKYFRRVQVAFAILLAGSVVADKFLPYGIETQGFVVAVNFTGLGWGYMFTSKKLRDMFLETKPDSRRKSVMLTQSIYRRIDASVSTAAYRMTASIVVMALAYTASSIMKLYDFRALRWEELPNFSILAIVDNIVVTAAVFFLWGAVFYLWRVTFFKLHDDLHHSTDSLVESFRQSFRLAFTPFSYTNDYASRNTFKRSSLAIETELVIHDI